MDDARPELNKAVKRYNRNRIFAWSGLGVALLAGIAAVAGAYFAYKAVPPQAAPSPAAAFHATIH